MATPLPGIKVGHWTDTAALTGCTVILFDQGTVASAEVRGGAPASRELEPLTPHRSVQHIDAAVLTGGSAFGLACADGVMRYCEEAERGVPTPVGRVPIVPTLGLYDLAVGDSTVRPGPEAGYAAATAATGGEIATGTVGAGTGATVSKLHGWDRVKPGGIAVASARAGQVEVQAIVAVNALGDIDTDGTGIDADLAGGGQRENWFANTTIGVVTTNARLDKIGCLHAAQGAHDGLARSIAPPHLSHDGDAFIAAATGAVELPAALGTDLVRTLSLQAVMRAVRSVAA